MSLLNNLLNQHIELLQEKGYTEEGLHNYHKGGSPIEQLRQVLSKEIMEDLSFRPGTILFSVWTTGFFNGGKKLIHFGFKYTLDPRSNILFLTEWNYHPKRLSEKFRSGLAMIYRIFLLSRV